MTPRRIETRALPGGARRRRNAHLAPVAVLVLLCPALDGCDSGAAMDAMDNADADSVPGEPDASSVPGEPEAGTDGSEPEPPGECWSEGTPFEVAASYSASGGGGPSEGWTRGGRFRPERTVRLDSFSAWLQAAEPTQVTFVVYEAQGVDGAYADVMRVEQALEARSEPQFVGSGELDLELTAGNVYLLMFSTDRSTAYGVSDSADAQPSWGAFGGGLWTEQAETPQRLQVSDLSGTPEGMWIGPHFAYALNVEVSEPCDGAAQPQ